MEIYYIKIVESIVAIFVFLAIRIVINRIINKTIIEKVVQKSRTQLVRRAINFILIVVTLIVLMIIWGVKQSELVVFIGSILTIVGVAFFAQWSLLSNITSSIILFFGHSVKIGDTISIMETKDYEIRGEVLNIGLFFTKITLVDTNDEITLPNNIFIIKTIRKVNPTAEVLEIPKNAT
ncbi:MAG: mechanosensitive ion channel [Phaeodactylibacter sp.]|uniref:mechanosensitive ion channel domain-containing protein n=1 Tax=Phaeodactylibacter sp. TaxID=1940289 RepID=UPI0032ED2BE1